jgi:hypothetical protein
VIIDGMMRVGKFYLGALLANMKRCEMWQLNSLLEVIPMLNLIGEMEDSLAITLFRQEMDIRLYYGLLGRHTNFRFHDKSSIWHHPNPEEQFQRIFMKEEYSVVENIDNSDAILCMLLHDASANARFLFKAYPDLKLIYGRRNPLDTAFSWHIKNWGNRIGTDPRSVFLSFKGKKGMVPWHALSWIDEYESMSPVDRIIESISYLSKTIETEIDSLSPENKKQVLIANYEHAVSQPEEFLNTMAAHIGTVPAQNMAKCLLDQRVPLVFSRNDWDRRVAELKKLASPEKFQKLMDLVDQHNQTSLDQFGIDTSAIRKAGD